MSNSSLLASYYQSVEHLIPAGYRRVDHLESTGTQWIDTGLVPTVNDIYEVDCLAMSATDATSPPIGSSNSETDSNFSIWLGTSAGTGASVSFGSEDASYTVPYDTSITTLERHSYKADLTAAKFYVDGSLIGTATAGAYPNAKRLILFGYWRQSSSSVEPWKKFHGKVWGFKATRSGNAMSNMVPVVRVSDSKPGMYDLCGSTCPLTNSPFYINSAAGDDFKWQELRRNLPDAYVYYFPMTGRAATADTGQALTYYGTVTATTDGGIPCLKFESRGYANTNSLSMSRHSFTHSIWGKGSGGAWGSTQSDHYKASLFGTYPGRTGITHRCQTCCADNNTGLVFYNYSSEEKFAVASYNSTKWHHYAWTWDSATGNMDVYIDGVHVHDWKPEMPASGNYAPIWTFISTGQINNGFTGSDRATWLSSQRLYNRILDRQSIVALAHEFIPTT